MNILIIDDEKFILSLLQRLLGKLGFENPIVATNGQEAMTLINQGGIDLIISDLNMPDMDGIELMRALGKLDSAPAVALVSGENSAILNAAERLGRALKLDFLGALPKPVSLEALEELMGAFDQSQAAKKQQRNFVRLTKDELQTAMDEGRVCVAFQPKICLQTGDLIGAETLARMTDGAGKLISPGAFIPTAEKEGLMRQLTGKVLEASFADMQELMLHKPDIKISVNVSIDDLIDVGFTEQLVTMFDEYGINPKQIIIEVTESKIMEDIITPLDILSRLRMRGIGLSIDDFGTGASGFENLQILPFTELKIDRAFVDHCDKNEEKLAILESMVFVAKKMKLSVVAEGIEREEELEVLRKLGVDLVQGFLLAKPMLVDDFIRWYEEKN